MSEPTLADKIQQAELAELLGTLLAQWRAVEPAHRGLVIAALRDTEYKFERNASSIAERPLSELEDETEPYDDIVAAAKKQLQAADAARCAAKILNCLPVFTVDARRD